MLLSVTVPHVTVFSPDARVRHREPGPTQLGGSVGRVGSASGLLTPESQLQRPAPPSRVPAASWVERDHCPQLTRVLGSGNPRIDTLLSSVYGPVPTWSQHPACALVLMASCEGGALVIPIFSGGEWRPGELLWLCLKSPLGVGDPGCGTHAPPCLCLCCPPCRAGQGSLESKDW